VTHLGPNFLWGNSKDNTLKLSDMIFMIVEPRSWGCWKSFLGARGIFMGIIANGSDF